MFAAIQASRQEGSRDSRRPGGTRLGASILPLLCTAVWLAAAEGWPQATGGSAVLGTASAGPAALVFGFVTDTEGRAVSGAQIEAYVGADSLAGHATSDARGAYSLSLDRATDFWELRVEAAGYRPYWRRFPAEDRQRLDVALHPSAAAGGGVALRDPRRVLRQASAEARSGRHDRAIALLREIVAAEPGFVAARDALGGELLAIGDLPDAENELRLAAGADVLDYSSHFELGELLLSEGRPYEAAPVLEGAVLADPTRERAEELLGRAYLQLGLGDRALTNLRAAQRLAGKARDLSLELSNAYALLHRWADAVAARQTWLAAHGADPRAAQVRREIAALGVNRAVVPPPSR